MEKISFTLHDAPDSWSHFETELDVNLENNLPQGEIALSYLIYKKFPQLKMYNRRIKNLQVIFEDGSIYKTEDLDIPGSLIKNDKL